MNNRWIFLFALIWSSSAAAQSEEDAITQVLTDQVKAWNAGDIGKYMEGYWKSDETMFLGGGNLIEGYHGVLARYKKAYATKEAMGTLEFAELKIRRLAPDAAVVSGIWKLSRKNDKPWGRFTLIVERKPEGWRITHDHTSTAQEPSRQ